MIARRRVCDAEFGVGSEGHFPVPKAVAELASTSPPDSTSKNSELHIVLLAPLYSFV